MQVAVGIVLTALVVEAVSHLVTNHHTDGTVVECGVGLRIEERTLQDAGGEAYLVGRRVVISIDSLRSHEPLVAVDGLACFVGDHLVDGKQAGGHDIVEVAL